MKERRSFTEEFKRQIVELHNSGKSKSAIMREYEISYSTLTRWISRVNKTGSTKEIDNLSEIEKELKKLRQENEYLKMENDVLKQAALILGKR